MGIYLTDEELGRCRINPGYPAAKQAEHDGQQVLSVLREARRRANSEPHLGPTERSWVCLLLRNIERDLLKVIHPESLPESFYP